MKQNVAIIFGGNATEKEISIITAVQMMEGYTKEEFNILPIFITSKGVWLCARVGQSASYYASLEKCPEKAKEVFLKVNDASLYTKTWCGVKKICTLHAVVNACHGGLGESGELDGLLRMCHIPSTSASVAGMSVSMDKVLTKLVCKGLHIPVVEGIQIQKNEFKQSTKEFVDKIEKVVGFPCVVKPLRQGSSIGISKIQHKDELVEAVDVAFAYDTCVVVESCVAYCKEFNIAIMGDGDKKESLIVSNMDEPVKDMSSILSFADKYMRHQKGKLKTAKMGMSGLTRKEPLELSDVEKLEMKQSAASLFKALHMQGVVRFDFLYNAKTKKWYLNEINAVPGSLAYYFFDEKGMSRTEMLEKMVKDAVLKAQAESFSQTDYNVHVL